MSTLETQYKQYQIKNPHSALMFEEWKKKILIPKLESIQEINKELLIEFTNDRYGKEFIKNGLLINSYDLLQIIKEEKIKQIKTRKGIWAFIKRKLFNRTEE